MQHKVIQVFIFFMVLFMIEGCQYHEKKEALENYVKKIKERVITEIEPLPEITPYEPFTYTAHQLRSPFIPYFPDEVPKQLVKDASGIHPDFNRPKEALESFPLDSLRMVGTLDKDNKRWALVTDPNGIIYRLTKGNYVGQNHGRIDKIQDEKMWITEIVSNPSGGWREKKASMALSGNDAVHSVARQKETR